MFSKIKFFIVILIISSACATTGLKLKQNAILGLQVSETSLEGAQNIERALCFNNPLQESGTNCTNQIAGLVGLNKIINDTTVHVQISRLFSRAFDAQIKAGTALIAWRSSDPYPTSVNDYLKIISELFDLVQQYLPDQLIFQLKIESAKEAIVIR